MQKDLEKIWVNFLQPFSVVVGAIILFAVFYLWFTSVDFARCSERAQKAGFDSVEVSHGTCYVKIPSANSYTPDRLIAVDQVVAIIK